MAIPVYLWLKDDGGADIKGSVDVQDREGSIEVVAQEHNLYIPTDNNTGKLTGTPFSGSAGCSTATGQNSGGNAGAGDVAGPGYHREGQSILPAAGGNGSAAGLLR